jgi:hypothetical protein
MMPALSSEIRRRSHAKSRCSSCGSRWRIALLESSDAGRRGVFHLEPSFAWARSIGPPTILADDALKPEPASMGEYLRAIAV